MSTHYQGSARERRALDSYIKLSRAAAAVEARVNRHLGDHGLTISQFGVLEALFHLGPLSQGQLAAKILKSSGNLTLVVDNLVKRGLVERRRDATDRRVVKVALERAGRRLISELFPHHVERVVAAFASLSSQQQTDLATLCRHLGLAQQDTVGSHTLSHPPLPSTPPQEETL